MIHALISLIYCLIIFVISYLTTPSIMLLSFVAAGFYLGREFTQAEYRYIEQYCNRKRANMPWYAPFTKKAWTLKGMLDWLLPLAVCTFVYFVTTLIFL